LQHARPGQIIKKGDVIGWIGDETVNGGWVPHLHLQLITDMLEKQGDFPGVTQASKRVIWLSISPDANLIARIPAHQFPPQKLSCAELTIQREDFFAKNLSLSYQQPLHMVRGIGQYLFDENGHRYLDCVNNVCHVGHCHPQVVAAGQTQMAVLNTNTRYLHDHLTQYAEKLLATFPETLQVCFFVNSGSEANELALRLAETHTGKRDILVLDHGYHGNTAKLVEISPYKFNGKGGNGKPDYVHILPLPEHGHAAPTEINVPANLAAFIGESLPSCAGQIVLPDHFLHTVYAAVRKAGGVCIADEVQTGLGRVGSHFYAFQTQDVVPDIVTLGKPVGNGHPLAAVITTRAIADSFNTGMEYFNSFGGNPVSCAIGMAVLNVLQDEGLQAHALKIGNYLKQQLSSLQEKFQTIKEVRGLGLFLGIELVTPPTAAISAEAYATLVVNRMKDRNILLSTDGPLHNVIKIKPPLVINQADCDLLVNHLRTVLSSIDIDD
jgi:4-aminobutyrate aminotransferase-like enzyme